MTESIDNDEMTWQWKLRVLFYYFVITIDTALFLIPIIITSMLGMSHKNRYYLAIAYAWSFINITKFLCGLNYEVEWKCQMPKGPCLILANHQSFWDNVIMPHIFPRQSWVIKKELYNIPFFGLGLRLVEPIAVDRSDNISVKQILHMGSEKLAEGLCVVMFPESTRLVPGQRVKMKPSCAKLAQMNKVPIVLMAHNAGVFGLKAFG
ncbi:MAG UNVERIFIED_CONTAM: 1-acyl-sn-glycerol-3-phosphate acyltransferase [Rickettsiaceae bacterium]|jgi:1-acyl-sn-glycerol-3-phosphate acyltransferase